MTTCAPRCSGTGPLPTPTTSAPNTRSTKITQSSNILSRANAFAAARAFRLRAWRSRAGSFTLRRVLGGGDLWVSELVVTYDGQPSYVVSIMEFEAGKVVLETQYFGEPFAPGPSRAQWAERMD